MRPVLWHSSGRLYFWKWGSEWDKDIPYGGEMGGNEGEGGSERQFPTRSARCLCLLCISGLKDGGGVVVLANASLYITKMMESSLLDIIQ